jgi:hypothetical protein
METGRQPLASNGVRCSGLMQTEGDESGVSSWQVVDSPSRAGLSVLSMGAPNFAGSPPASHSERIEFTRFSLSFVPDSLPLNPEYDYSAPAQFQKQVYFK